jgi:hypothetical protein
VAVTKDVGFPVSLRDTSTSTDFPWPTFTTPGTNRMVVAMLLGNGPTVTAMSAFTSPNLTWTNKVSIQDGTGNWTVEIWIAWAASVVTTEQINSTYSGSPFYSRQSGIIWSLDGADSSSGGNTGTRTSTTDPTVDIVSQGADGLLLMGLPYRSAGGDLSTLTDSVSEYNGGAGGGFNFNERAASRATTGAGSLAVGYTNTELFSMGVAGGVEIKAAAGGGGGTPAPIHPRPIRSGLRLG